MRRAMLSVVAVCATLALPSTASAARDVLNCDFVFMSPSMAVDATTFSGPSGGHCEHVRSNTGFRLGGATATTSGTWSATDCGSGRLAGRLTISAQPQSGPIAVEFDISTTGGVGAGQVSATDGEGGQGGGAMTLYETFSHRPCPTVPAPFIPIQVGPVDMEIGDEDDELGLHTTPLFHASVKVVLD